MEYISHCRTSNEIWEYLQLPIISRISNKCQFFRWWHNHSPGSWVAIHNISAFTIQGLYPSFKYCSTSVCHIQVLMGALLSFKSGRLTFPLLPLLVSGHLVESVSAGLDSLGPLPDCFLFARLCTLIVVMLQMLLSFLK